MDDRAQQPSPATEDGPAVLHRKLVWLNVFRLGMVTVLLGGTSVTSWHTGIGFWEETAPLWGIILATYAAALVFALLLRLRRWTTALAYAHVSADVALAAGVVASTGYSESVFVFLFTIGIVTGSILLYRRGAAVASGLALVTYLALVATAGTAHGARLPTTTLFVHGSAFLATAALASYLSEQLRRTGERLAARESDLAEIRALHESIVQSVSSGLLTADRSDRITFLNRAGEQITGLELQQVRSREVSRWFGAFEAGDRRDECDFVNARGDRLRLGYGRFPLLGRDGEQIGSAVIFQDLTDMRAMEARVQRSERLAELGRVAAGLAHELRNPLASMTGCIELIRSSEALQGEDRQLLDIVLREAARLDQLVTRFLEFSRPAPPKREETDLARLLEETLRVFANDPSAARIRLEPALRAAVVSCDPDQMRQVFWNLLANAAHFAGTASAEGGRIRVSCVAEGSGARVVVEDDGPGIAPGDLPRLFTPFFTTRRQGTGLGLATVQRIVDAHGGSIEVESPPGHGAMFTIHLPATPGVTRASARAGD